MNKIGIIKLRSGIKAHGSVRRTLRLFGLKNINSMVIVQRTPVIEGVLNKINDTVTWGELSEEMLKAIGDKKLIRLKPPKKGLKSKKAIYPKGDLGYRGDKINELIKRML